MGILSWQMKRFWDEAMFNHWGKVDGKVACAFSSSGGWGGGAEIACQSLQMVLMNFGFLVFGVTDYSGKTMTAHYGAVAAQTRGSLKFKTPVDCSGGGWPSGSR